MLPQFSSTKIDLEHTEAGRHRSEMAGWFNSTGKSITGSLSEKAKIGDNFLKLLYSPQLIWGYAFPSLRTCNPFSLSSSSAKLTSMSWG